MRSSKSVARPCPAFQGNLPHHLTATQFKLCSRSQPETPSLQSPKPQPQTLNPIIIIIIITIILVIMVVIIIINTSNPKLHPEALGPFLWQLRKYPRASTRILSELGRLKIPGCGVLRTCSNPSCEVQGSGMFSV